MAPARGKLKLVGPEEAISRRNRVNLFELAYQRIEEKLARLGASVRRVR